MLNTGPVSDPAGDVGGEHYADGERLLSGAEVAALLEISPSTWRNLVAQKYAPPADDPGGDGPANRRNPRWRLATVVAFVANRPGRTGRPRKAPR